MIGKGNYRHFMQKEIFEQPAVVGDTLPALVNPATRTVHPVSYTHLTLPTN